jgi:hypothetical protein
VSYDVKCDKDCEHCPFSRVVTTREFICNVETFPRVKLTKPE